MIRGLSSPGSSSPVTAGLKTRTRSPAAESVAATVQASTVLPTSVSVPVTNRPGVPATGLSLRRRLKRPGRRGRLPSLAVVHEDLRALRRVRPGRRAGLLHGRASCLAAQRISAGVCVAIAASRRREVPSGTVGGLIACAKTPRCSAPSQTSTASVGVAHDERNDLGLACRDVESLVRQRAAQDRRVAQQRARSGGAAPRSSSSAASAAATDGGGGPVEKIRVRAVFTR